MLNSPTGRQSLVHVAAPMRACVHGLRNLFAVVAAAKSLLRKPLDEQNRLVLVDALGRVADEGKGLTNALLAGAKDSPSAPIEAGSELRGMQPMLSTLAGFGLTISTELDERLVWVGMPRADFEAIMLELAANSKAAGAKRLRIRAKRRGGSFWLLIADDGTGFPPPALRDRASVPGVHGNGLRRIASASRAACGRLRIRSKIGAGSVIALILPVILSLPDVQHDALIAA